MCAEHFEPFLVRNANDKTTELKGKDLQSEDHNSVIAGEILEWTKLLIRQGPLRCTPEMMRDASTNYMELGKSSSLESRFVKTRRWHANLTDDDVKMSADKIQTYSNS